MKALTALLITLIALPPALAADAWSRIGKPLPGPPEAIGFYSGGCIAGAAALPLHGEGYQVMRPSRNRYYGHPSLIAFVEQLGRQAAARGRSLLIGDLAQPRGGPMAYGHSSHQSGLDVDVWFHSSDGHGLTGAEIESLPMVSMIDAPAGRPNPARWSSFQREMLKLAAAAPEVERIFVNPIIKLALCRGEYGDRTWLRKLRPWWGHDAHFHVRLRCPPGAPQCRGQEPVPPGDGCDADLDRWVWEIQHPRPSVKKPRRPPVLPKACGAVLNGY